MGKNLGKNESLHITPWHPDRPVSKGATAFHEAVSSSSWIRDILFELVKIINNKINAGDRIVDFGAGTGTSALLLLKNLQKNINLLLVDNSPSWLAKSYELLHDVPNVEFFLLEKRDNTYATLAETIGNEMVNHVISANTVHLIPDLEESFAGIADALKGNGTFTFQTGNFVRKSRPKGALMIDDTVKTVHDIAVEIIRTDGKFEIYREGLNARIENEKSQRKFVFPEPRPIKTYLNALRKAGFDYHAPYFIPVKVKYSDWLNFLRVKRLQTGILPEVGGKDPSPEEEEDRDNLITQGAIKLFKDLETENPLADDKYFTIDIAYVTSIKK